MKKSDVVLEVQEILNMNRDETTGVLAVQILEHLEKLGMLPPGKPVEIGNMKFDEHTWDQE